MGAKRAKLTRSTASGSSRADAARRGWETRRAAQAARVATTARRSAAAKLGHARRAQELAYREAERKAIVGDKAPDFRKRRTLARGKDPSAVKRRSRVADYIEALSDDTDMSIHDLYDLYYGYTEEY